MVGLPTVEEEIEVENMLAIIEKRVSKFGYNYEAKLRQYTGEMTRYYKRSKNKRAKEILTILEDEDIKMAVRVREMKAIVDATKISPKKCKKKSVQKKYKYHNHKQRLGFKKGGKIAAYITGKGLTVDGFLAWMDMNGRDILRSTVQNDLKAYEAFIKKTES